MKKESNTSRSLILWKLSLAFCLSLLSIFSHAVDTSECDTEWKKCDAGCAWQYPIPMYSNGYLQCTKECVSDLKQCKKDMWDKKIQEEKEERERKAQERADGSNPRQFLVENIEDLDEISCFQAKYNRDLNFPPLQVNMFVARNHWRKDGVRIVCKSGYCMKLEGRKFHSERLFDTAVDPNRVVKVFEQFQKSCGG